MKTRKITNVLFVGLFALLLCLFMDALHQYQNIIAVETYRDVGIHELQPYGIFPVKVKNETTFRRTFPYRSAYFVYYSAMDDASIEWRMEVSSQATGKRIVEEQKTIMRRLLISETGESIALLPDESKAAYCTQEKRQERWIMIGTGSGVLVYVLLCFYQWKKKHDHVNRIAHFPL